MMDIEEKATKYGVSSTLLHDWNKEQIELKKKIILSDSEEWQKSKDAIESEENCTKATLQYVAGVDISYRKDHEQEACTACVVCSLPDLEVSKYSKTSLSQPPPKFRKTGHLKEWSYQRE
ncbi:endonuclease V-like [Centruroides sculpturatus]|uniref:endonuclease V-like n=1 Tax=Centruroides sculpturatus TaxID=218467 RepID=UPI000C6DAB90|nr:endonuclease V-like [Centruroides sculpturatus]